MRPARFGYCLPNVSESLNHSAASRRCHTPYPLHSCRTHICTTTCESRPSTTRILAQLRLVGRWVTVTQPYQPQQGDGGLSAFLAHSQQQTSSYLAHAQSQSANFINYLANQR
eukprot:g52601.t1